MGLIFKETKDIKTILGRTGNNRNQTFDSEEQGDRNILPGARQTQQNDLRPSEDADQPGLPPSLISVFVVRLMGR